MAEKRATHLNPGRDRFAVIAGNGRFPFLVLQAAREQGVEPLIVAIKEEASPELQAASKNIHWLGLSEVGRCLDLLVEEGVARVMLAGQVKHAQIFGSVRHDGVVGRILGTMRRKNTDALIGAFVKMVERRGIEVVDSTLFLKPLLADEGSNGAIDPDKKAFADVAYGREVAKSLAGLDIGQTIVVSDRACVAVEAMEGTDSTIERAASLANGRPLVVVKVSKPRQDMRFDVPVVGLKTIEVMHRANAKVLALDARKTLLFERDRMIAEADQAGISIWGMKP